MFISKKHLSRRTVLRGMGAVVALPMMESMLPALTPVQKAGKNGIKFVAIEMVHGSAGATKFGAERNLWSPAADGRNFDFGASSLKPLEPYREHLTIISNTDC